MKAVLALLLCIPVLASADLVDVKRNTVIEVTADQDLSIRDAREGDRFTVTTINDRDLPRGSQLLGEILQIREKRGSEPASMDLEFRTLLLPDGTRHPIQALPIALDNKNVSRGKDGRFYADAKKVKNEYYVFGGMLGGLVIGAMMKKPFEGAFVGTLAGIILGEIERENAKKSSDLVLKKGTRLGAVVLEDVNVQFDSRGWRDRDREDRLPSDRIDLRFDDRALRFEADVQPYAVGRTIMVPMDATARQLGLRADRVDDRVFIENDDSVIRLTVGERGYRFEGRRGDLPAQVEERGGQVYVPIEVFAGLVRRPIFANGMEVKFPA